MYGAETMVLNLASAQKAQYAAPTIGVFLNRHCPHLEIAEEARNRGLRVEVFDCSGQIDFSTLRGIRRFLRANDIEVVHGHGYKSNVYAYLATTGMDAAFVATCHLWTGRTKALRFYEFLDGLVMRRAARVAGVSDVITQALEDSGLSRSRLSTIYNGTDFVRFRGAVPSLRRELGVGNGLIIGTVGRLEEQKGIPYFIQAARGILSEFPEAVFVVVGEGSQRAHLQALIREQGLDTRVLLLGERRDMPGVYASLDLFVLASIDEGMPMTILEAMAARRPVVATRVGAVEKLVLPGQTGLLVPPGDVPALREAVLECLRDSEFSIELGRNGENHVLSSYSAAAMASRYHQLYGQALHPGENPLAPVLQRP